MIGATATVVSVLGSDAMVSVETTMAAGNLRSVEARSVSDNISVTTDLVSTEIVSVASDLALVKLVSATNALGERVVSNRRAELNLESVSVTKDDSVATDLGSDADAAVTVNGVCNLGSWE